MRRVREWLRSRGVDGRLLGVALRFVAYFAAIEAVLIALAVRTPVMEAFEVGTADVATRLIAWSGVGATRAGRSIYLAAHVLLVNIDCTGAHIAALLTSLLLAYPVSWSRRLLGAAAGLCVVGTANLGRLVLVAHLSAAPADVFQVAHDLLFQVGMVLVAAGFWAVWLAWVRRNAV